MPDPVHASDRRLPGLATTSLWVLASFAWLSLAANASAQPIGETLFSPDIDVTIGAVSFADEDIAYEDFVTAISPFVPIPVPAGTDVVAQHVDVSGAGTLYFAIDRTADLPGGILATPRDVVAYDGVALTLALAGAPLGIPAGARIDALSVDPVSGRFVVSLDVTAELDGQVFADEDLIAVGGGAATLYLDGSAVGLDGASADIDALSIVTAANLVLSLDGSGQVGGLAFDDEDLLVYTPALDAWAMAYDASVHAPPMQGGPDIDAVYVPEPGAPLLLVVGVLALLGLARVTRARAGPVAVLSVLVALALVPDPASAVDGVVEVNAAAVTAGGITPGDSPGFPATISVPGSYVLTGGLVVPSTATIAIQVTSSDVSIDLNGFSITGASCVGATTSACRPTAASGHGVSVDNDLRHGVSVRNGSIVGVGGIGVWVGQQGSVSNVRTRWNGSDGIRAASGSVVSQAASIENGQYGIFVYAGSTVERSVVNGNLEDGIYTDADSLVVDNTARGNSESGIFADTGSTVRGNTATGNKFGIGGGAGTNIIDNTVKGNTSVGLSAAAGGLVQRNSVYGNTGSGVSLGAGAAYRGNVIDANGSTVTGGIDLGGNSCNGTSSCP